MRATWIADRLRAFGLDVVEHDGWKKRGKDGLRPQVVVAHHTAGPAKGDAPSLDVVIKGRADLPGPLCHVLLARSGTCHVIASGIANHAGAGGWLGSTGNASALGIEAEHVGLPTELWPPAQLLAYHRAAAALLAGLAKDERSLCGHKEWAPKRKIDPVSLDMDAFRKAVAAVLREADHQEDDMPLTKDEHDMLWGTRAIAEANTKALADFRAEVHASNEKRSKEIAAILDHLGIKVPK